MSSEDFYRANSPKVIHETIDGEAVMIHMDKGYYYSLDKTGSAIWNMLEQGTAVSQIASLLQKQFSGDPADIEEGLRYLISELKSEELIVPGNARPDPNPTTTPMPQNSTAPGEGNQPRFIPPELHKYTDMEDLLLLDPIHEVDDTGWPVVANET